MSFDSIIIFFAEYSGLVLIASLILFALIKDRRQRIFIFLEALTAAIVSRFGFTEIIRYFYDKPRPFEVLDVRAVIEHSTGGSFPSGHAAFFFALAATLFIYNKKWGSVFFLAAILMGIARVVTYVHWPIDIVAGAAVGITSSLIAHLFFDNPLKKQ